MCSTARVLLAVAVVIQLVACKSVSPPDEVKTEAVSVPTVSESKTTFDPASIPPEVKMDAMEEIKGIIDGLNKIIRHKDYLAWKEYLTADYIDLYSAPEVLAQMSDSSVLKRQDIVLRSLEDYFLYVVYPSRQSVRVDDIEFTSPTQVKAVTVAPSGDRQVYYYLEKTDKSWKIGTGR